MGNSVKISILLLFISAVATVIADLPSCSRAKCSHCESELIARLCPTACAGCHSSPARNVPDTAPKAVAYGQPNVPAATQTELKALPQPPTQAQSLPNSQPQPQLVQPQYQQTQYNQFYQQPYPQSAYQPNFPGSLYQQQPRPFQPQSFQAQNPNPFFNPFQPFLHQSYQAQTPFNPFTFPTFAPATFPPVTQPPPPVTPAPPPVTPPQLPIFPSQPQQPQPAPQPQQPQQPQTYPQPQQPQTYPQPQRPQTYPQPQQPQTRPQPQPYPQPQQPQQPQTYPQPPGYTQKVDAGRNQPQGNNQPQGVYQPHPQPQPQAPQRPKQIYNTQQPQRPQQPYYPQGAQQVTSVPQPPVYPIPAPVPAPPPAPILAVAGAGQAATCPRPGWEPCISKELANERFRNCCARLGEGCAQICSYDQNLAAIQVAVLTGRCPVARVAEMMICASGYEDATPCCEAYGVFEPGFEHCRPYCNPTGGLPNDGMLAEKFRCLGKMSQIQRCFYVTQRP